MALRSLKAKLGGGIVAGVPGPRGPQGIPGPYYRPEISQTADDRFTIRFMESQEHMPGVNPAVIILPAGGSTHVLTADDRLDDLTGNGVWYLLDQPETIRNLMEAAGIEQPAELTESQEEWTPMGLIVTVTRGYQAEPDPENPTGLPHQQVSVYYVTSEETAETDGKCYRFQMDRVQVFKDYSADGNWTKWRSLCPVGTAPGLGQEGAEEIFFAKYGETTLEEISEAHYAGKFVCCKIGGSMYHLAGVSTTVARFACVTADSMNMITVKDGAWSQVLCNKVGEIKDSTKDDYIPSVGAVRTYVDEQINEKLAALTNVAEVGA